jgi:hypothetical protein
VELFRLSVLISLILLGLIPATIAQHKGQSLVPWWIYGSLLFVIALPHAFALHSKLEDADDIGPHSGKKQCSYCTEWMPWEDDVCPCCHLHQYDPVLDGPGYPVHQHV